MVDDGFFEGTITTIVPDDHHVHLQGRRQCQALLRPEAAVDVEVRQCLIVSVQVQYQIGVGSQLHQAFLPLRQVARRAFHGQRMIEGTVEVLPGGFVKTPQQLALTKLADTEGIRLGYHGHAAPETALVLTRLQARQQLMQHQHPGDFIGVHARLKVHTGPTAVALKAPGADVQRVARIAGYLPRKVFCHALPSSHYLFARD